MKEVFLSALTFISLSCYAQKPLNLELKKQLDTILRTDQGIREFLDPQVTDGRKDTIA